MRVALFGGSFDPPHRGHFAIAHAAVEAFALDRVLFAPAARQPLKRSGPSASYDHRLAMVALACAEADPVHFISSTLDAPLADGSPNYTVRTLELAQAEYPRATLFNLVGADSFAQLAQWRDPQRLLQLAEWIVVSRPGIPLRPPTGLALTPTQLSRIHLLDTVHEDIAATTLRHHLATPTSTPFDSTDDLLPPSVATYIAAHSLYRTLLQ
jgi:nicotinate-nucleotide adenylyltransferase